MVVQTEELQAKYVFGMKTGRKVRNVGIGGYCVCTDPDLKIAMGTEGAGTCQIIVVHTLDMTGAIGHYSARLEPNKILAAVDLLVEKLGKAEVETILFAAGLSGSEFMSQDVYADTILHGAEAKYREAQILWPDRDHGWGACVYVPDQGEAALFDSYPGQFFDQPTTAIAGVEVGSFPD